MLRFRPALTLALAALCAAAAAMPQEKQDNPDRPPWAQKKKADKSKQPPPPRPDSQTVSHPVGDPSVHPPVDPGDSPGETASSGKAANDEQGTKGQRNRIRVDVNLVTVLASVLDEKNRPAPDLSVQAFQLYEEGVQ